jgi:hypothetical protein
LTIKKRYTQISTALILSALLIPSISRAELGGNAASVLAEQKEFGSLLTTDTKNGTTVYIQTLASGTILKEFLSSTGVVYAVSWSGPSLPNLQIILGSYFKNYLAALKQSRGSIFSTTENVVIQSSGMMGAFQGFAFLPKQAPSDFTTSSLGQ